MMCSFRRWIHGITQPQNSQGRTRLIQTRSHIIRPFHSELPHILGHGNLTWNSVGSVLLASFNTNDTASSSLMHNIVVLKEGGRHCSTEITSISLTAAHSALLLLQRRPKRYRWVCFCSNESVQALQSEIGLEIASGSRWPLACSEKGSCHISRLL